eukprot:gnl/TRDRNA2_/TRDRNA2_87769_c0_seq1.p1 gnl/TRDRNA2_/TRDRNA2_87769_c0~~gnl/TRDRNA2_/TRDRNA2_87769_c0_seq1.p1  ORF type:complete len:489 (+),score=98.97 gnl/TRDRNA2_/TRDRNA2_87769_c0_seq1:109-1467(+)
MAVDDFIPMNDESHPLCSVSEYFPSYSWPSLIEKAYAKFHRSWEALGGGGHVEEALTDLTGGCSSRFGTRDVAADRMWQYIEEMLNMDLCIFGCSISQEMCSRRNIPISGHWAAAIYAVHKEDGVPYVCVCTSAPAGTLRHFPICDSRRFNLRKEIQSYGLHDGYVWLRVDDFTQLFENVYECRLVNSSVGKLQGPREDPYLEPAWASAATRKPWYEDIWAINSIDNPVVSETCPMFEYEIRDVPCIITMEVSQEDVRMENAHEVEVFRGMQVPLLLRFWECAPSDDKNHEEIYMVHMSAWGHTRDATTTVKILSPGKYVAMVSMPMKYLCRAMFYRTYSTKPLKAKVNLEARHYIAVVPSKNLKAIPYTMVGFARIDSPQERLPQMFEEGDGKGKALAGWRKNLKAKLDKAAGHDKDAASPGLHVVGAYGGKDAVATMKAAEVQDTDCSVM